MSIIWSIKIGSKGGDRDEILLLHNGNEAQVVILFIPELSRAHPNTLSLVRPNDDLHAILVPLILVQGFEAVLRFIC